MAHAGVSTVKRCSPVSIRIESSIETITLPHQRRRKGLRRVCSVERSEMRWRERTRLSLVLGGSPSTKTIRGRMKTIAFIVDCLRIVHGQSLGFALQQTSSLDLIRQPLHHAKTPRPHQKSIQVGLARITSVSRGYPCTFTEHRIGSHGPCCGNQVAVMSWKP